MFYSGQSELLGMWFLQLLGLFDIQTPEDHCRRHFYQRLYETGPQDMGGDSRRERIMMWCGTCRDS